MVLGIGVGVTAVTAAVAWALAGPGSAGGLIFWPNALLQYLVPTPNIGTPDQPFYDFTPLKFVALVASVPLAIIVYSALAYVLLRRFKT